jgi:hypothetical protein
MVKGNEEVEEKSLANSRKSSNLKVFLKCFKCMFLAWISPYQYPVILMEVKTILFGPLR